MEGFFSASQARLVRPMPTLIPRCDQCGIYKGCRTPKMKPSGEGRRRILVVGEYPGRDEDNAGTQFVGRSGQWLEEEFARAGADMRRDCWLTNALICHSPDAGSHRTAVDDCRPNLLKAIADLKPAVIILLGGAALNSLIPHVWKDDVRAVSRWVGWRIPCRKPNAWICPLNNPAYLLRSKEPVLDLEFRRGLKAALTLGAPPWPDGPPDEARDVRVELDPGRAAAWLNAVRGGAVAFDFETDRLKPNHPDARIVCCGVCRDGGETIAFPWAGAAVDAACRLFVDPAVKKVGWNASFEHQWCLNRLGVEVRGWVWDGMLSAHALDPRGGVSGLKFQAFVRLGAPDYNRHVEPFLEADAPGGNAPNRIREVSPELLCRYCGLDAILEYRTAEHQAAEMGMGW